MIYKQLSYLPIIFQVEPVEFEVIGKDKATGEELANGPLMRTEWYRVIADEAHTFRT